MYASVSVAILGDVNCGPAWILIAVQRRDCFLDYTRKGGKGAIITIEQYFIAWRKVSMWRSLHLGIGIFQILFVVIVRS